MSEKTLPPAVQRATVTVTYLDGTTQTIELMGQLQVIGSAVILPTARGGHVGLNLAAVRCWEATVSSIAVPIRGN